MTGARRVSFGDLLDVAAAALAQPADPGDRGGEDVQQACHALRRLVAVMGRYLHEAQWNPALSPKPSTRPDSAWDVARTEARTALLRAAAWLPVSVSGEAPRRRYSGWLASRFDSAAQALAAGHDLLQTHFAWSATGTRAARTEWAPVLASALAERAVLLEIGQLAHQVAARGARVATRPGWRASPDSRQRLNAACQTLWCLSAEVRTADESEPLPREVLDLLRSVPPSLLPPRSEVTGTETVASLCGGAILAAERGRRAAWRSGTEASWSPAMSNASLRILAGSSVVISHNNYVILSSLGMDDLPDEPGRLALHVHAAAYAAARMREEWLRTAHALDALTTDTRSQLGAMAASADDLARWTGRIAYRDPEWNPGKGPTGQCRTGKELAAEPETMRDAISAVHHASYALVFFAAGQHRQVQAAAATSRILVPTNTVPDTWDIPCPFVAAPAERIDQLLDAYASAQHASAQATAAIANVAEAVCAPSAILKTAADLSESTEPGVLTEKDARRRRLAAIHHADAGPVERILRDLDISDPELLRRAVGVDQAGQQLVLEAAERQPFGYHRNMAKISSCVGTAAVANGALLSSVGKVVAESMLPESQRVAEAEHGG